MPRHVLSLRFRLGVAAIAGALGLVYPSHPALIVVAIATPALAYGFYAARNRMQGK